MTVYGYARVSTRDQDLIAQDAELMAADCAKVFKEKISGAKTDRPELAKVIRRLEPGDVLWPGLRATCSTSWLPSASVAPASRASRMLGPIPQQPMAG